MKNIFKMIGHCIFLLLVLKLFVSAQPENHPSVKYGAHCNKTVRCDAASFLECRNSTCECYKQDTMYYEPAIQSCLVLVRAKCRYKFIHSKGEDNDIEHPHNSRGFEEELNCVPNAWCNRSGVCMCSDGYVELSNGTCISKRTFEESCTSDFECREDRFLTCINGRCGCNETVATYNVLLRQCVGKAGQPCIGIDGCVYNADCSTDPSSRPIYRRRRARQDAKICSCNSGFVSDDSGNCRVGLGGECSTTKPCANSFSCKNGQCVCKYENVQLAMLRSQECISLVGGPCNETRGNVSEIFDCVDNAECTNSNATLYGCKCNDGFVENNDGTCDLAFGAKCNIANYLKNDREPEGISFWKQDLICDRSTPLACVDGICQCESSLYVFDGKSSCLGKYGARCRLPNSTPNDMRNFANQCIPGAECVSSRELSWPYGKCACSFGFKINTNRTCSK